MSDSESDEDLKRAIALSLQQNSATPPPGRAVIDLISSDDDDDDLDAPISTKRGLSTILPVSNNPVKVPKLVSGTLLKGEVINDQDVGQDNPFVMSPSSVSQSAIIGSSLLGLNRKQMEEERRLRAIQRGNIEKGNLGEANQQRKRKPSQSPPLQDAHRVKAQLSGIAPLRKETLSSTFSAPLPSGRAKPKPREILSFHDQQALSSSGIQYPQGVMKKTWAYGFPREGDDIKIEEVFQKSDLELAVLSSFQIDSTWIESKLNPRTRVIWVLQAKTEAERANYRSGAPKNYGFCFPNMDGNINCMHSKLQLLAHPSYLRVCVPTANLVPYDWGETGVMENVCFLIDLPRLSEGTSVEPDQLTEFGKELLNFVRAMGLHEKVVNSILKFDFSQTSHLAFVHSIGGSHSGTDWKRIGYCGLAGAIRQLGLHTEEALTLQYVTASLGNINDSLIKAIYLAAKGDNGLTEYQWRTDKKSKSKVQSSAEKKVSDELKDGFQIYFPTRDTVSKSRGGIGAGGTICFHSKWYDSASFPRHLMRDCKSKRTGLLTHSKMLLASCNSIEWVYIGSANLSESAWGRLVKDRTTKETKLNCRNWECGVLVSFPTDRTPDQTARARDTQNSSSPDTFRNMIPVPMIVPGEKYGAKRPWFYEEK